MLKQFLLLTLCSYITKAQVQRECTCTPKFIDPNQIVTPSKTITLDATDSKDNCDFRCKTTCAEEVKQSLNIENGGLETICQKLAPDFSISKDGFSITYNYDHTGCRTDEVMLHEGTCCKHCECSVVSYDYLSASLSKSLYPTKLYELQTQQVVNGKRAYKCSELNQDLGNKL